jgi:hypothetical protein
VGGSSVSTEAVMDEVRDRVRAELFARLVAQGAGDDFASREVFDEVDRLFDRALAHEHPRSLLLAARLPDPWQPALSLDFPTHRRGLPGRAVRFAKSRLVLPVVRWLYEHASENFRRQHQVSVALMACLQTLAAEQAQLKARLAEVERRLGGPAR